MSTNEVNWTTTVKRGSDRHEADLDAIGVCFDDVVVGRDE